MLEMYRGDAMMNGLDLDIHNEEKAIEMFAENVMTAGQVFLRQTDGYTFYSFVEPRY